MAYTGPTTHNPVSGERVAFPRTAVDMDGELLEFELDLAADARARRARAP